MLCIILRVALMKILSNAITTRLRVDVAKKLDGSWWNIFTWWWQDCSHISTVLSVSWITAVHGWKYV